MPLQKTARPLSSSPFNSSHTSKESTVPPGKKCPTLRVRTTTSTRTVSPGRNTGPARSSGAATRPISRKNTCPGPPSASSPTAKVVDATGPSAARRRISGAAGSFSAGEAAKMSTVTALSCRKRSVTRNCSASWLANGTAVLAAGNRCEWTIPLWFPRSFDGTSGIWQSTQFEDVAG